MRRRWMTPRSAPKSVVAWSTVSARMTFRSSLELMSALTRRSASASSSCRSSRCVRPTVSVAAAIWWATASSSPASSRVRAPRRVSAASRQPQVPPGVSMGTTISVAISGTLIT